MAKGVCVIGGGVSAAQCALALAEMGIEAKVVTPSLSMGFDNPTCEDLHLWPLLLRAASHPLVALYTNAKVKSVAGKPGKFIIKAERQPRYVSEELCTACGRCEAECSVEMYSTVKGRKVTHSAIHAPILGGKSAPSAFRIEKNGIAPCRASCPLGINVQGFTALLAKGKVDRALDTIIESAPLPGILGRLCTHPCEAKCSRSKLDDPLFIQALHRYAADKAPGGIKYQRKHPAGSRKEKIVIVGSGPAGLTCAWELVRRGYAPTIFEDHGVVGGMLATGIPRFRLPREVREREVEAIRAMGIDIKTGVIVGRDITYSDLMERGYKAFFLAIGAQQNNKLNIPGEDLDGVADSMSLLFALNLKVGAGVGANVVVIGGGNSAVDCARTAKRRSKGDVRILCITKEMTAVREEVEEAIKEGVKIDYLVNAVEILGDGQKVNGIRCQRLKKVEFTPDGRPIIEPIPGSEFEIKADHVVVSIGQRPNTPTLNIKNLELRGNNTIKVDPLTLVTNIPGVFAGGDCVTGPNNVVSAMAAGLQAAESIDRYLRGHDLTKGRSLEKPQPVEVDIKERKASPYSRADMPVIPLSRRRGSYEETNLGLQPKVAEREAERCLNCALCSECKECEQICVSGAICHSETTRQIEIEAESVINFVTEGNGNRPINRQGINNVATDGSLTDRLAQASAAAMEAAIALKPAQPKRPPAVETGSESICDESPLQKLEKPTAPDERIGVVLCRCGDSISSVLDFNDVTREIARLPGVSRVLEVDQACREEGSYQIAQYVNAEKVGRLVLAACRCCNLEQVCFSCTDRRIICQRYLNINLPAATLMDFVNLREQCSRVHADDPAGATLKAIDLISAGVARAGKLQPATSKEQTINSSALVAGGGLGSLAAARDLAALGYRVTLVSPLAGKNSSNGAAKLLKQMEQLEVQIYSLPQSLELNGSPGSYEAVLKDGTEVNRIQAGAVILDLTSTDKKQPSPLAAITTGGWLSRILSRSNGWADCAARDFGVKETGGIFVIPPDKATTQEQQVRLGAMAAVKASAYLHAGLVSPRAHAININKALCRGCGDCALICPYVEMKVNEQGVACAWVDPALCYGCGACVALCPTGAITQPTQGETEMTSALEALLAKASRRSEANVVVFACNWDGLSCVEAAAIQGFTYPATARVIRVPCLSRVHAGLMLKAFELGAGGVMLLGCEPGNCHFGTDNQTILQHYEKARLVMKLLGLEEQRLVAVRLPAGDGAGFVKSINGFTAEIERMSTSAVEAGSGAV